MLVLLRPGRTVHCIFYVLSPPKSVGQVLGGSWGCLGSMLGEIQGYVWRLLRGKHEEKLLGEKTNKRPIDPNNFLPINP